MEKMIEKKGSKKMYKYLRKYIFDELQRKYEIRISKIRNGLYKVIEMGFEVVYTE